jgi:hypothetical protein
MSERTSDQEFVRLFSPKVLERLGEDAFDGAVHVFRSTPGAGKTTLLRAFTPAALRSFWRAKGPSELGESFGRLAAHGVIDEQDGPQLLGVLLSCASGYADLPPDSTAESGLFRALFDCRVVLRTLRSLAVFLGFGTDDSLRDIRLDYSAVPSDLNGIPRTASAEELASWAEEHEKGVYAQLDGFGGQTSTQFPTHQRLEGVLWLQSVGFTIDGSPVAPRRLLMVDDVQKLTRKQRTLLIEELTVMRPSMPVWLAMRSLVLGEALLSQGAREGRDLREYTLEEMWGGARGTYQFAAFAQSVLDKRMHMQNVIPDATFQQCLREHLEPNEIRSYIEPGIRAFQQATRQHERNVRYSEWLARAERKSAEPTLDMLLELYVTRILLARDAARRQMTLELALSAEEIDDRDNTQVRGAAEIFIHRELGLPYYYGLERLCVMASTNIEELLALAAALYAGAKARQILRKRGPELSPSDQEELLVDAAKRRLEFVPKSHTEGTRAYRLLQSIGSFCRERTFLPNAPYAPGVTGVRLSQSELEKVKSEQRLMAEDGKPLLRVLSECVAENLLVVRPSAASTGREPGTIFYLNRTLCAYFGLPLQMGGWQDVSGLDMADWMTRGKAGTPLRLEVDA